MSIDMVSEFANGVKALSGIVHAKRGRLAILPEYQPVNVEDRDGLDLPDGALIYGKETDTVSSLLVEYPVAARDSMPFDDPAQVINCLHENMGERMGLVEVRSGRTRGGNRYVYHIRKHPLNEFDGLVIGMAYLLKLNIEQGCCVRLVDGSFEERGTTGYREALVRDLLMSAGSIQFDDPEWAHDPYDPDYRKGLLMNRSEAAGFDELFPGHPLSEARSFVNFLIEHN